MEAISTTAAPLSFLGTRRGKLTLVLMCAVGFIDLFDASIVNIALPQIRTDLHFSVQSLQWVAKPYLLTYGGFLLLGGRAADLLGRRRLLVAGTSLFGISSLVCGLAGSEGVLIGARLAQGVGRGDDDARCTFNPDDVLSHPRRSGQSSWRLGWCWRRVGRCRSAFGWRAHVRGKLALGFLCQRTRRSGHHCWIVSNHRRRTSQGAAATGL